MVGRIAVERTKLLAFLYGAELGHIERAIGKRLHAQHVVDANPRDPRPKKLRPLRHSRPHKQLAIAAAFDRQLLRTRVLVLDQVLRTGDEVVKYVLLLRQGALDRKS